MGRGIAIFKNGIEMKRKCHDCGKPTNDYRCEKCLAKWRIKHRVSPLAVENGNFTSYKTSSGRVAAPIHD